MSKVPIAPLEEQLDVALDQKTPKRSESVDYGLKFLAAAIGGTCCSRLLRVQEMINMSGFAYSYDCVGCH